MRAYIVLFLVIHTATATVDLQTLQDLKQTAATNIQSLKETATTNLQSLKDTAATQIQNLQTKATESLQEFVETIDLDKVKQLDILNILPKLQYKGQIIQDTVYSIPEYKKKIRYYLQSLKGITGQDLVLAFDAGVPWPVKRMDDNFDQEYAIDF